MDAWILRLPEQRLTSRGTKPVVVLHVTADGEETELEVFELGASSPTLKDLVQSQIEQGHRRLILDLSAKKHLDSSELANILEALKHSTDSGGELVAANLNPRIREIFRITQIDSVIPIFDSAGAAARHCGS